MSLFQNLVQKKLLLHLEFHVFRRADSSGNRNVKYAALYLQYILCTT
jgi:hypothetical protein